jgi:predicted aconitase with swiveling domain
MTEGQKIMVIAGAGAIVGLGVIYAGIKVKRGADAALASLGAPLAAVGAWVSELPARFEAYKAADAAENIATRADAVMQAGFPAGSGWSNTGIYVPEGFNMGGYPSDLPISA